MALHKDNVYSFDENTILHSCSVKIPKSFLWLFEKSELKHKNQQKIFCLLTELQQQKILSYKFVPSVNFEFHLLQVVDELIMNTGVQSAFLPKTFKIEIMDQLQEFSEGLVDWGKIEKAKEFESIKDFFKQNARQLQKSKNHKYSNIPEDDDCQILAGLVHFSCQGTKFLLSEDEHFWAYSDLILKEYNIQIIKEWECDLLV